MMKTFIFWMLCLTTLSLHGNSNEMDRSDKSIVTKQALQKNLPPEYLYKIVSPDQWQESQLQDHIVTSPIDKDFIHLATEEQLPHVIQKFWENKDYLVLKLSSKKLTGRLMYEANPGGTTLYYHLYEGSIPLDAVVEISKASAFH